MKQVLKIPLAQIKDAVETFKNTGYTAKEWETLLYGWRQKKGYLKRVTNKGWLREADAQSLICYTLHDKVKITFAGFAVFVV